MQKRKSADVLRKIAPLFADWQETFICSCLQGQMGYALAGSGDPPTSAQIVCGDFCFFAGQPSIDLAAQAAALIIIPQNEGWAQAIEAAWGGQVQRTLRYATCKNSAAFDLDKLSALAVLHDERFVLRPFGETEYQLARAERWSCALCDQYADYADFSHRGMGMAILCDDKLVAGASSYIVYRGGIEIEIDTAPAFRRLGLATACGAALMLACLERGLYPNWDAYDLRSLALAQKLGYVAGRSYPVYMKTLP